MKTFGKICSFISAIGLTILAISAFSGYTFSNSAVGIFFTLFAVESAVDGFVYFKRPKNKSISTEAILTFVDGAVFRVQPIIGYSTGTIELGKKPLKSIDVNIYEVSENE